MTPDPGMVVTMPAAELANVIPAPGPFTVDHVVAAMTDEQIRCFALDHAVRMAIRMGWATDTALEAAGQFEAWIRGEDG